MEKLKKVGYCFDCNSWIQAPEVHEKKTKHAIGYYYRAKGIEELLKEMVKEYQEYMEAL